MPAGIPHPCTEDAPSTPLPQAQNGKSPPETWAHSGGTPGKAPPAGSRRPHPDISAVTSFPLKGPHSTVTLWPSGRPQPLGVTRAPGQSSHLTFSISPQTRGLASTWGCAGPGVGLRDALTAHGHRSQGLARGRRAGKWHLRPALGKHCPALCPWGSLQRIPPTQSLASDGHRPPQAQRPRSARPVHLLPFPFTLCLLPPAFAPDPPAPPLSLLLAPSPLPLVPTPPTGTGCSHWATPSLSCPSSAPSHATAYPVSLVLNLLLPPSPQWQSREPSCAQVPSPGRTNPS